MYIETKKHVRIIHNEKSFIYMSFIKKSLFAKEISQEEIKKNRIHYIKPENELEMKFNGIFRGSQK